MNKRQWIYESHIFELREVNMKAILAVMNTTWAVVKIRPKKFRPVRDLNPWPLRYGFKRLRGLTFFQALFSLLLKKCSLLWRSFPYFFSCMDEYYVLNTYVLDFTPGYRVQNQQCGVMVILYNLTRGSSSFQCCHMIVNEPIEIIH